MKRIFQISILLYTFIFADTASLEFTSFTGNGDGTGTLDISMKNDVSVAGYEIYLSSSFSGFTITSSSGGSAQEAGFLISNGENVIFGFSLTGATISDSDEFVSLLSVNVSGIDVYTQRINTSCK